MTPPPVSSVETSSPLHLHVTVTILLVLGEILEHIAALEVFVGVYDGLKLGDRHDTLVLGLFDFILVYVFEDATPAVSVKSSA